MAYNGLNWQVVNISFAAGLLQKADDRARPSTYLDICRDVQFDEIGGIQTRYPYAAMNNSILGGGTLANCRRLAVVNGELVVFTVDSLYSWSEQLAKWVLRGTHLAVDVLERRVFVGTGDQIETDRAELNGTVVTAWTEQVGGFDFVFVAAEDKATGAVIMTPNTFAAVSNRPRLVALATKILLFAVGATGLEVRAIDPANPQPGATGAATTVLAGASFNQYYDVVRVDGQDQAVGAARRAVTTSYTAFTVTAGLTLVAVTKARTADGPLAVATITGGTQTQVVRGNTTNIQGDLLTTSTLADVFTGQAIGTTFAVQTPVNQITASFVGSTCHVFWSANERADAQEFHSRRNTVTTANVVGTQAELVLGLGIASRAFTCGGRAYVWLAFAGQSEAAGVGGLALGIRAQLQNSYFLYRDDGRLISKAAFNTGGGFATSIGRLPGVASTSATGLDFAWCGNVRRIIQLGGEDHTGFDARSPVDITFSFDSDRARRNARLGRTLYIGGGLITQYDGVQLAELGFQIYPWYFVAAAIATGGDLIPPGTYSIKNTLSAVNAVGERERSTTATGYQLTFAAPAVSHLSTAMLSLWVTLKTGRFAPAIELWRTATSPAVDVPFFLVTSKDPNALAGDNRYIPNDPALWQNPAIAFRDNFTDAVLATKEANPENGDVLEDLAAPGARIIFATDTRIYLLDVAGDEDALWYSKQRNEGSLAAFHDVLRAQIPRDGGRITAGAIHSETPVVFRETAIYRLPGDGLNNTGQGQNFVAFTVATDVGAVNQESVALVTSSVGTIFKSRKGWYVIRPGWNVDYIGAAVSDYDSETVYSVDVVETAHKVKILTSGRMLIWDYLVNQWGEEAIADGVHSVIWNGSHVYLTATGPKLQGTTYTALTYGIDVETAWIKLADLQGAAWCRRVQPFGAYLSACLLRLRIAYNYKEASGVPLYVDDKCWAPTPAVVGGPLQLKHGVKLPQCEAIKVRITAVTDAVRATRATATLVIPVQTSGTAWAATLRSAALGEYGNSTKITLAFVVGAGAIDVRDHFQYDPFTGLWSPDLGSIGVLVTGTPTVAQLEAAIFAGTALATFTVADPTPGKIVNVAAMAALGVVTGTFTGGAFGVPTGEAFKLTGLGLEVGSEQGLYRRLPAAQQQ